MKDNDKLLFEISNLVIRAFDNSVSGEEFERLQHLLSTNPVALQYYFELLFTFASMDEVRVADFNNNQRNYGNLLLELGEYEKTAPEIFISQEKPQKELIQKVEYPKIKHRKKLSKWGIGYLVTAAAAVVFMVLFIRFAPSKSEIEVATLTDSIDAKWADAAGSMGKGVRLTARGGDLFLREGLAELLFDNNAKIVIEGPAEFELLTRDQVNLRYGRIYATVPQEAIGFTINTPQSRIIDLGTEFGIHTDAFGDVYLHVIKGKTMLISEGRSSKVNLEITEGQAKKVSGTTQEVSDIPCEKELFVRDISSRQKSIWKGQMEINLAYIVAGGNGFTGGRIASGIDPTTGEIHPEVIQAYDRLAANEYKGVGQRPFIDGVFVPNGSYGPTVIDSAGHTFAFPQTDEHYFSDITASPYALMIHPEREEFLLSLSRMETGQTMQSPLIYLHANAGITFDLDRIRQTLPNLEIDRFKALCGISRAPGAANPAEFWILVDGISVFHHRDDKGNPGEIDIPITSEQKFLSLVATDGGDGITLDWCVFESPRLELKMN